MYALCEPCVCARRRAGGGGAHAGRDVRAGAAPFRCGGGEGGVENVERGVSPEDGGGDAVSERGRGREDPIHDNLRETFGHQQSAISAVYNGGTDT